MNARSVTASSTAVAAASVLPLKTRRVVGVDGGGEPKSRSSWVKTVQQQQQQQKDGGGDAPETLSLCERASSPFAAPLVLVEAQPQPWTRRRGKILRLIPRPHRRRGRCTTISNSTVKDENEPTQPAAAATTRDVVAVAATPRWKRLTKPQTVPSLPDDDISSLLLNCTNEDAEILLSDFSIVLESINVTTGRCLLTDEDERHVNVEPTGVGFEQYHQRDSYPSNGTFEVNQDSTQPPVQSCAAPNVGMDPTVQPVSMSRDGVVALALPHELILYRRATDIDDAPWCHRHSFVRFTSGHFTSVAWCPLQSHVLAVGTSDGCVTLYDTQHLVRLRQCKAHTGRLSTIAWRGGTDAAHGWSTGGADGRIVQFDVRCPQPIHDCQAHRGDVRCIQWHPHYTRWASGGADGQLLLWDLARTAHRPVDGMIEPESTAGIAALTWSPGGDALAVAGGRHGSHIRILSPDHHAKVGSIDTGSSVTALTWTHHTNRLVSSHASSQICAWHYPSLSFATEYIGHTSCVLHMGECRLTNSNNSSESSSLLYSVAADELVHIWKL